MQTENMEVKQPAEAQVLEETGNHSLKLANNHWFGDECIAAGIFGLGLILRIHIGTKGNNG